MALKAAGRSSASLLAQEGTTPTTVYLVQARAGWRTEADLLADRSARQEQLHEPLILQGSSARLRGVVGEGSADQRRAVWKYAESCDSAAGGRGEDWSLAFATPSPPARRSRRSLVRAAGLDQAFAADSDRKRSRRRFPADSSGVRTSGCAAWTRIMGLVGAVFDRQIELGLIMTVNAGWRKDPSIANREFGWRSACSLICDWH